MHYGSVAAFVRAGVLYRSLNVFSVNKSGACVAECDASFDCSSQLSVANACVCGSDSQQRASLQFVHWMRKLEFRRMQHRLQANHETCLSRHRCVHRTCTDRTAGT
eukprot:6213877-Pleurochrysis_carterae.AAC.3